MIKKTIQRSHATMSDYRDETRYLVFIDLGSGIKQPVANCSSMTEAKKYENSYSKDKR